jgi:hypothetical protein
VKVVTKMDSLLAFRASDKMQFKLLLEETGPMNNDLLVY